MLNTLEFLGEKNNFFTTDFFLPRGCRGHFGSPRQIFAEDNFCGFPGLCLHISILDLQLTFLTLVLKCALEM